MKQFPRDVKIGKLPAILVSQNSKNSKIALGNLMKLLPWHVSGMKNHGFFIDLGKLASDRSFPEFQNPTLKGIEHWETEIVSQCSYTPGYYGSADWKPKSERKTHEIAFNTGICCLHHRMPCYHPSPIPGKPRSIAGGCR